MFFPVRTEYSSWQSLSSFSLILIQSSGGWCRILCYHICQISFLFSLLYKRWGVVHAPVSDLICFWVYLSYKPWRKSCSSPFYVWCEEWTEIYIFCLWILKCSNTICWKGNLFFTVLPFHLCQKSVGCICDSFILDHSVPLIW